ncbi:tetratricopeptide repeat protein [Rhizobacter sp. Root404]|uniref:tetratricopeptide repeat protein n=1 Tax=Rhizobacter sp. Root404 TaxID=1736528 RepID=UPI0006F714C3|nr:tetratricopeptide repeat protein [Rhizobacter sp. Root404]KQW39897.1 thioredoxin [Rhizobacter sp. Root404]
MQDISLQNFESDLITASMQQPVLLDIWAPWCGPCKSLGPVLEKLETDYGGRFVLAKLNSDEQPEIAGQLSQMFGVRSIPFCVLFKGGQPVDGFVGALPEAQVRAFLDKHVPSSEAVAAAEDVEEAQALLADGDTDSALEKLQEAVAVNPGNDAARYDYLRALLGAGRIEEARRAYEPVATKVMLDARLAAAGRWLEACEQAGAARSPDQLAAAIAANKRDFDARFELAQGHFAAQRFTQALDELLEILMRDKAWKDELARKTFVAILELMTKPAPTKAEAAAAPKGKLELAGQAAVTPADPVVDGYRRKLSMTLF